MVIIDAASLHASPVLSLPNAGAAVVRPGDQQPQPNLSPSAEQIVRNNAEQKISKQDVQQAIEQANQALAGSNEAISFGFEERLGQLYVQVTDRTSGKVVREIPPRDFIQHRLFMHEMIGMLLDRQA